MTIIPSRDFQTAEFRKVAVLEQFDFPVDIGNVQMRQTENQMAAFFDKADQFPVERFIQLPIKLSRSTHQPETSANCGAT